MSIFFSSGLVETTNQMFFLLEELGMIYDSCNTVDASEILRSPVEVGGSDYYLRRVEHTSNSGGGLGISEPSTVLQGSLYDTNPNKAL